MIRLLLLLTCLLALPSPAARAAWDAALVELVRSPALADRTEAREGQLLAPGARLETGPVGGLALKLPDGSAARLGAEAKAAVLRAPDGAVLLQVLSGPAWLVAADAVRSRFKLGDWTLTGMDAEACVEPAGPGAWRVAVTAGSWQLAMDAKRKLRLEAGRLYAWPAGEGQITILTRRQVAERQAWFTF